MTLEKALEIIDILQDKYGSAYLTDGEKIDFVNMGTYEYLNRLLPDGQGGVVNFEQDRNVLSNIQPLLYDLSMSGATLTTAAINTALATASGEGSATYFKITGVGVVSGGLIVPATFMKNNNRWSFERNVFKRPSASTPYYKILATGITLIPSTITTTYLSVVKNPKTLTEANLADTLEFGDYAVYNILSIALKFCGVSTRDGELLGGIQQAATQISQ
jgi:hypothetical protein